MSYARVRGQIHPCRLRLVQPCGTRSGQVVETDICGRRTASRASPRRRQAASLVLGRVLDVLGVATRNRPRREFRERRDIEPGVRVPRQQTSQTIESVRLGKVDAEVHKHSFDRLLRSLLGVEAHGPLDANVRIEHKFGDRQTSAARSSQT